jgi:hypothetical protein
MAFNTRLIELVAIALHEIGVLLFQLRLDMHQGDIRSVDQWNETPPGVVWCETTPEPTLLNHHGYLDHDVYPNGVAGMVGYWAENRILGGVVVFNRSAEQRTPTSPPNVYFHSSRQHVTHRYCQLRDEQQEALVGFLLAVNLDATTSPLPILPDKQNLVRVNGEHALKAHLYRDEWERKPPTWACLQQIARGPRSTLDYPEEDAFLAHINTFPTYDIVCPAMPVGTATGQASGAGAADVDEEIRE